MREEVAPRERPTETAMRIYRALNRGDLSSALMTFDREAVWVQPGTSPVSGEHRGHHALARLVEPLLARGLRMVPLESWAVGPDRVVVLARVELAGEAADEIDIMVVRNGLITQCQHIGDTAMLERAFKETK